MPQQRTYLNILIIISSLYILSIVIFLQYINPCLYEIDGYYHIRVPYFIRESGLRYNFPWAQFSTFKNCYSDKEFLFHILILPFTFIGKDFHTQARISIIFFALLLLFTFIFVQKKYVSKPILTLSILSLSLSILFLTYINYLRPKTLTITLILILLYLLIEKKWLGVFIICLLYPLTHISFPIAIILGIGVETMRYLYNKEFYIRNPLYSLLGISIGIFLHPNFPNNFGSLHFNAILVPWNTIFGNLHLDYGVEWNPTNTKIVITDFLLLFVGLFFAIIFLITKKTKIGFHTIAFFFATSFFSSLSMFSLCYWYFTYPVGLIFLSMFFSDYLRDKSNLIKNIFLCAIGIVLILKAFIIKKQDSIPVEFIGHIERNSHYESMANWMNEHIPPGEIIYHTSWSDSPYFICLNPKDYYLTMLDPIYMYYYSSNIYNLYNNLSNGFCDKPARILRKVFKSRYGYTHRSYGLYNQIKNHKGFKILFEDDYGAIFKLLGPKDEK